jgi:hypothetical protein
MVLGYLPFFLHVLIFVQINYIHNIFMFPLLSPHLTLQHPSLGPQWPSILLLLRWSIGTRRRPRRCCCGSGDGGSGSLSRQVQVVKGHVELQGAGGQVVHCSLGRLIGRKQGVHRLVGFLCVCVCEYIGVGEQVWVVGVGRISEKRRSGGR